LADFGADIAAALGVDLEMALGGYDDVLGYG
jgi:hypothetical protein